MTKHHHSLAVVFAAGLIVGFGAERAFAAAPDATPPGASPNQQLPAPADSTAAAVDNAKLDHFVDALAEVQTIQKDATEKQSAVADADAAKALQADTQTKMTAAVEKHGLKVAEFNQLAQLMISDTQMRARVSERMQQRKPGG